jgi:hypothetical protein
MRREERRVRRLQRAVNYSQKQRAYSRASNRLWDIYIKMEKTEILSRDGALALIEMVAAMLELRTMMPVEVPALLSKARLFLTEMGS